MLFEGYVIFLSESRIVADDTDFADFWGTLLSNLRVNWGTPKQNPSHKKNRRRNVKNLHTHLLCSESRGLSVQVGFHRFGDHIAVVSISESRYLSFQVVEHPIPAWIVFVSISESRYLSFQGWESPSHSHWHRTPCFNLVIEVLVVSSWRAWGGPSRRSKFQSRNRGTCRFKSSSLKVRVKTSKRFNFVIEVLVVSRRHCPDPLHLQQCCFNFVIEVLVVSRIENLTSSTSGTPSFNFVIEVLVVSSLKMIHGDNAIETPMFQFRNRGTCRFKLWIGCLKCPLQVVSIS